MSRAAEDADRHGDGALDGREERDDGGAAYRSDRVPTSVPCRPLDLDGALAGDDGSDLTDPSFYSDGGSGFLRDDDEAWEEEGKDAFGVRLAVDAYRHLKAREEGGRGKGRSRSRGKKRHEEILNLRRQLEKQQEKLDRVSSKLRRSEAEGEVREAERLALLSELARAKQQQQESPPDEKKHRGGGEWFPKHGKNGGAAGGGSMQMLIDANSKLMADNARLSVSVDVMRKSFRSFVEDARKTSHDEKKAVKALRWENETLREKLREVREERLSSGEDEAEIKRSFSERDLESKLEKERRESVASDGGDKDLATRLESKLEKQRRMSLMSDCHTGATGETYLGSSMRSSFASVKFEDIAEEEGETPRDPLKNSLHSIPEADLKLSPSVGQSGDDWIDRLDSIDLEDPLEELLKRRGRSSSALDALSAARKSDPLLSREDLDRAFGDFKGDDDAAAPVVPRRRSTETALLVDFGESEFQRPRGHPSLSHRTQGRNPDTSVHVRRRTGIARRLSSSLTEAVARRRAEEKAEARAEAEARAAEAAASGEGSKGGRWLRPERQLSSSFNEGTSKATNEGLLVDFDEGRRLRAMLRIAR
ncbi:hypothetical protein ACHAWF_003098 [Thalassiosira exigua]